MPVIGSLVMDDAEISQICAFLFGLAGSLGAESAENCLVFLVQSLQSAEVLAEQLSLVEPFRAETEVEFFISFVVVAEDVGDLRLNFQ